MATSHIPSHRGTEDISLCGKASIPSSCLPNRYHEDSDSETSSADDCDSLAGSVISTASSVSSGPDDGEVNDELPISLDRLRFSKGIDTPTIFGSRGEAKEIAANDLEPKYIAGLRSSDLSIYVASISPECHVGKLEASGRDNDGNQATHMVEGIKLEETEETFEKKSSPPLSPFPTKGLDNPKSLPTGYKSHGSGNNQGQSHGGSIHYTQKNTQDSPVLVPSGKWGRSRQKRGNGGEDSDPDEKSERINEISPIRRRTRRVYACPGAKGDPFRNRECLRSHFPNLAKTRQHLACGTHFAVGSTIHLPDEVKDPHGWDEIMKHIYPGQEVPSSEPDFDRILDVIAKQGKGVGKPDFLSHMMRMVKRCMEDPDFGRETLDLFKAIAGEQTPPTLPSAYPSETMEMPEGSMDEDMINEASVNHHWAPIPHPPHHAPPSPSSSHFSGFSSPVNVATPTTTIAGHTSSFSTFSPAQSLYSPAQPLWNSENQSHYSLSQLQSSTYMGSGYFDQGIATAWPDPNNSPLDRDFEMQIDVLPQVDGPASAPPPDRRASNRGNSSITFFYPNISRK